MASKPGGFCNPLVGFLGVRSLKIVSVEHSVPETLVTNPESIDRMSHASKQHLSGDELAFVSGVIQSTFEAANAETRHIIFDKEQPLDLVVNAAERALDAAGITPNDLEFILFGGVTRRYLVPSSASVVQNALGAFNATCFDVIDACASWARALQVADSFLSQKTSDCGLILSNETGFYNDCNAWEIRSVAGINKLCSSFTLGEAATAMVVSGEENTRRFKFHSKTYGQHGNHAVLPIVETGQYTELNLNSHDRLKFQTETSELTKQGLKCGLEAVREANFFADGPADCFVAHAGAEASIESFLNLSKIPAGELVLTFREYGNTVASSIPLGLSLATSDGRINRGDRVFLATAAAGISIVGAIFEY